MFVFLRVDHYPMPSHKNWTLMIRHLNGFADRWWCLTLRCCRNRHCIHTKVTHGTQLLLHFSPLCICFHVQLRSNLCSQRTSLPTTMFTNFRPKQTDKILSWSEFCSQFMWRLKLPNRNHTHTDNGRSILPFDGELDSGQLTCFLKEIDSRARCSDSFTVMGSFTNPMKRTSVLPQSQRRLCSTRNVQRIEQRGTARLPAKVSTETWITGWFNLRTTRTNNKG